MSQAQSVRRWQEVHRTDSRRERKKQETHQRLLQSAWELFQEKGYDRTTVEDITEAADVGKGTFFNYFETKQALLDEIALWRIELLGSQVLATDDVPDSALARIKLVMNAMADEFAPKKDLTRHLFTARLSAPIRRESAHRLGSLMYELVRQGQANQEIRGDLDPALVTRLLLTCFFHAFVRWHRRGAPSPPQARPDAAQRDRGPAEVPSLAQGEEEKRFGPAELVDMLMSGLGGPEWSVS